jgi:hypothetical protein
MDINSRNRNDLKAYFKKNSIPTEGQFAELIDGMLNQKDDGIARPSLAEPLCIQAAADAAGLKQAINFFGSFQDPGPAWTLLLNPHTDSATAKAGFCISDGQGVSRLFIDSATGNVGIGTLQPATPLHIVTKVGADNPSYGNPMLWGQHIEFAATGMWGLTKCYGILHTWDTDSLFIGLKDEGSNRKDAIIVFGDDPDDSMRFLFTPNGTVAPIELLRITANGNVGIGTNSPSYRLDVAGSMNVSESIRVNSTSSPPTKGAGGVPSNTSGVWFKENPGGGGYDAAWIQYYARTGEACTLEIGTSNDADDHIALMPSGNVGIGTLTPKERLNVVGRMLITSPDKGIYSLGLERIDEDSRLHTWAFWHMNSAAGQNDLQIWEYKTDKSGVSCGGKPEEGAICTQRLTIQQGGNVGIGTTTPNAKLHVIGDTMISGGITVGAGSDNVVRTRHVKGKKTGQDGDDDLYLNYDNGNNVLIGGGNAGYKSGLNVAGTVYVGENLTVTGTASIPGGAWTNSSDERLKQNIHPLDGALDKLLRLRGMEFEWKEPEKQGNLTGPQMGLVAQEVETVFPEWVGVDGQGYRTLTIRGFEALAIEAIKELKAENENLKKRCEELEAKL